MDFTYMYAWLESVERILKSTHHITSGMRMEKVFPLDLDIGFSAKAYTRMKIKNNTIKLM